MTKHHTSSHSIDAVEGGAARTTDRDAIGQLFGAALDGDSRAEAALHLLGGFDATAHRASWALLRADQNPDRPAPPDVLASVDRTLAVLRDRPDQTRGEVKCSPPTSRAGRTPWTTAN